MDSCDKHRNDELSVFKAAFEGLSRHLCLNRISVMKIWKISTEYYHESSKNSIIGVFSARLHVKTIRLILEGLAHMNLLSLKEQISASKYNKPGEKQYTIDSSCSGRTLRIGKDPIYIAQYCDINPDDFENLEG